MQRDNYEAVHKDRGTLDWYQRKYGDDEGKEKYLAKNKKISIQTQALKQKGLSDQEIAEVKKDMEIKAPTLLKTL